MNISNLVALWTLAEVSGSRSDSIGANHLTDVNTVGSTTGRVGTGAQFVRANAEALTIADNAALSMGNIDFTFTFWVNFATLPAGAMGLVTKWDSAGGVDLEYLLYFDNASQKIGFILYDGSNVVVASHFNPVVAATWYFVVATYDATNDLIKFRLNHGVEETGPWATGARNGTATFMLGATSAGDYLDGIMDQVAVWKRVLTELEQEWLYNAGNGRTLDEIRPSMSVGGTAASGITETDVVAGGKTITLTLTGDTWAPTT